MIKVGIIGAGLIAREHAKAIAMTGGRMKLLAACDTQPDRLQAFCAAYDVTRAFCIADDLLKDPQIDLVVVATPPSSHEALVVPALKAGKYVLCEKPLAHSLGSAARITEVESRHPGKLSVSHQLRYQPSFQRLSWIVKNDWLGEIQSALVERHSEIPERGQGGAQWWGRWNVAGGGVLLTQSIHELDLLIQLLGMPQSVAAVADTRFSSIESEDYIEATFRYADARTIRCIASVNSGTVNGSFGITGNAGSAGLGWLELLDENRQRQAAAAAARMVPVPSEPSNNDLIARVVRAAFTRLGLRPSGPLTPHARLYLDIADAITMGRHLPISGTDALASLELCMATYESVLTGKPVRLPLSPKSAVYEGVQAKDYVIRACNRNVPSSVFIPRQPSPPRGVSQVVTSSIKWALANVGLERGHIKALLKRRPIIHGGPKARHWPWPRRRHIDRRERRAVDRLLRREMLFGDAIMYDGTEERAYCSEFAKYLGGGYADAVNAGSNALYLALRALELPPGSEVIVPPATDAGGLMPVALNLCIPVPADAAPGQVNTSVDQIRAVISDRTSAIVVAHIAGYPLDMDPILTLANERGIPLVEDCAQAHGAIYKGRMVGTLGAISAFSTMFGKHHCTGGQGGVVFSRDPLLFARARQAADRGKAFGALQPSANVVGSLNFNQDELAMAFGRVQLSKLPGFLAARRQFAALVDRGLTKVNGVSLLSPPPNAESAYLFLLLKLELEQLRCDSEGFARALEAEGITDVHAGYPIHPTDHPWHRQGRVFNDSGLPWSLVQQRPKVYELPNARQSNRTLVRVDIHEGLGEREAKDLLTAIRKVARHYAV